MSDIKPIEKEAAELIEAFKLKLKSAADEIISKCYVDLIPHIESDAFLNFRNDVRLEVQDDMIKDAISTEYGPYSFGWTTRKKIFEEYREELIRAINVDHVSEIERLKEELKQAYSRRY